MTKKKIALTVLLIAGAAMLALGGLMLWPESDEPEVTAAPPRTLARQTDKPGEKKPDPKADYRVAADMPRRIIMPSIGVNGFIQQVGMADNGAVGVPDNIHVAGWFTESPRPGEEGVSLIDGHVQGWHAEGIFRRLDRLAPGDKYQVEFGDYSKRGFEVISVREYGTKEVAAHMLEPVSGAEEQLNLITCSGRYIPDSEQYEKRLLVTSKRID